MGEFKRDVYYELQDLLNDKNIIFLLGPRKCGKTVALQQINKDDIKTQYIDFKNFSEENSMDIINKIINDIHSGEDQIYLLDEITHAFFPETEIAKIASAYTEAIANNVDIKTKIIFSGSQSVALEAWGRRAFCNQAEFINLNFLSYPEWLRYKERNDITAKSYEDFVKDTSEFYHFTTIEDYLRGCLEETVVSNANSRNFIYGNDCDLIDANELVNILYLTLFSLHDVSSAQTFFKNDVLSDRIAYISRQIESKNPLSLLEVRDRISKSFLNKYNNLKAVDMDTLKQSFAFLIRCNLITATPIFSDMDQDNINVLKQLENTDGIYKKKNDLLGKVNFTINYPMFFVEILKEILKEDFTNEISGTLMGSIVECHVRGLLPSYSSFEYHDELDREIDYINRSEGTAIEITIANKNEKNIHLNLIPEGDGYKKILLTKDINSNDGMVEKIPYYEFIYGLSGGRGFSQPAQSKEKIAEEIKKHIASGGKAVMKVVTSHFVEPLANLLTNEKIPFLITKDKYGYPVFVTKDLDAKNFLKIQKKVFSEYQPPKLEPEINKVNSKELSMEEYDDI